MKLIVQIAGPLLAVFLNGAMAREAATAARLNVDLLHTLDAVGAFVSLEGRHMFLTSGANTNAPQPGFWYNIEGDAAPELVCPSLPHAWQVAVAGDHAFVCDYTRFLTVYAMRERQWRQTARLPMPGQTENIVLRGGIACIANHVAGLTIVDISTPSRPVIVSNFNPGIDCDAVALWRNCAILYGHWESRLILVDVSDPAKPRQTGLYQHEPKTFNQGELAVENGFAYCTSVKGLVIVNVADPAAPALAAIVPFDDPTTGIAVIDARAFVASRGGIRVFDVRDPGHPAEVGRYKCPAAHLAVRRAGPSAAAGHLIYVANKRSPATVLRFHDPAADPATARGDVESMSPPATR